MPHGYTHPVVAYAVYETQEPEKESPAVLNIADYSIREIKEMVSSGLLTAEEVYAAESGEKYPRTGIVKEYAPKDPEEPSSE